MNVISTGNGGIFLQGGDRMTLSPSSFVVSGCDISFFNRWVFTYAPGIFINGVGQQVYNNFVHNGPHMVRILFYYYNSTIILFR